MSDFADMGWHLMLGGCDTLLAVRAKSEPRGARFPVALTDRGGRPTRRKQRCPNLTRRRPPTVVYRVRNSAEEWIEFQSPVTASRRVADNIMYGYPAQVEFHNANDLAMVREKFKERIDSRLRELGHKDGFWCEDDGTGAHFRLHE